METEESRKMACGWQERGRQQTDGERERERERDRSRKITKQGIEEEKYI